MHNVFIALENLRSLYNIGAIFRTCSFFDIEDVLLVGHSGKDYRTLGDPNLHSKIHKTALGSENDIRIEYIKDAEALVSFCTVRRLKLVCVEQTESALNISEFFNSEQLHDIVFVFGNERDGISSKLLESATQTLCIPRHGRHNSLNVSSCVALVCYLIGQATN